jgi:hypothetical protein
VSPKLMKVVERNNILYLKFWSCCMQLGKIAITKKINPSLSFKDCE